MSIAHATPTADGSDTPLQDGRFLLIETLGRGAMGTVYRAFDRDAQRLIALKVSLEHGPAGPSHPLAAEFDVASRLRHPSLVAALELAHARCGPLRPGTPYLVLEHADGLPADRALRAGRVDARRLGLVATRLLLALDHLHRLGFIHRDLKPANVLVARPSGVRPEVRLTDFGLAVPIGTVREPGRLSGSLPYLAPEALLGLRLDARTDLYALGLLLFYLGTGTPPVARRDPEAWVRWHLDGPPADLAIARPDLPEELGRLVRSLTERDPARRPPSALEALSRLGARVGGGSDGRRLPRGRDRARLRLALDAARLGAVRLFRLPADGEAARELLRELAVWAQVRGLDVHELPGGRTDFARLVVKIATERSDAGMAALRRYALDAWLPFEWVGGVALVGSGLRPSALAARGDGRARIEAFLLECARRRPFVLSLPDSPRSDDLAARVARGLLRLAAGPPSFRPGHGGLLVVAPTRDRTPISRLSA